MTSIVEAVVGTVSQILVQSGRSIDGLRPQVTIEEAGKDVMFITNHPVETGAAISDHAFRMPAEIEMRCGWSDSGNYQGYSQVIYRSLLAKQNARQPFTAVTGKRTYRNMVIQSIDVLTNGASEYALMVRVVLREVIIVSTQSVSAASSANQSDAARTSGVSNSGTKQAVSSDGVIGGTGNTGGIPVS